VVWVATPKNTVERVGSILVIERKSTSARYFCLKCSHIFFGSKKRIKQHLRGDSTDVKHCTSAITPEEDAVFLEDDLLDTGRGAHTTNGEGARRKRKRTLIVQQPPLDVHSQSPFVGHEPPPASEGWRMVKDPRHADDRLIWVSVPKNDIERLPSVYVVERRTTTCRYMCTKCNFMYWGSKKRVKEHLRDQSGDVKGCSVRITAAEEELLQKDDALTRVRPSRAKDQLRSGEDQGEDTSMKPAKRVRTGPGKSRRITSQTNSPFLASEPPPDEEGWTKGKASDGQEIWIAEPKNSVERLQSMVVIERRCTGARYMCTKCHLMFWGSKKRIKEHLRRIGTSVTGCTQEPTYEEEEVMRMDDPEGDPEGRFDSPFLASGPPPSDEGWSKQMLPDGQEVWAATPKNGVERLSCVLILER